MTADLQNESKMKSPVKHTLQVGGVNTQNYSKKNNNVICHPHSGV